MANYQEFKDAMGVLETFIEKTDVKEIEGVPHITIDENNVDEFREIMENLIGVAVSEDNYVDDILEYLNELDTKITDRSMITKFIPLFAALHSMAKATKVPETTTEVNADDWVFEVSNMDAPLDARIGKVLDVNRSEEGVLVVKMKAPLANDVIEWEDAVFVVIPEMEATFKKYQDKYTKIF